MRIVKKILKWALRVVLIVVGFLLLLSILVFIPPVQNFIKDKAAQYVSDNMGFDLDIERLRLRFPLTLSIDNTVIRTPQGDTLLRVGELHAGVAIIPLLSGAIEVRDFRLENTGVDYRDSLGTMQLRGTVGKIGLQNTRVRLSENSVQVGGVYISDAALDLRLGESRPDTATVAVSDTIPWKIAAGKFDIERLAFNMHTSPNVTELAVNLPKGSIDDIDADLSEQLIGVGSVRLDGGDYSYLTDTATVVTQALDTIPQPQSRPWTVRVGRAELGGTSGAYGSLYGGPQPGFDPSHVQVSGLGLRVDSIYNRSSDISAVIRSLELRERSGLEVTGAEGRFAMDSSGIRLAGFTLRTAASSVQADASAGPGIMEMSPQTPLTAKLKASLADSDLFLFYPADPALRQALKDKTLTVEGDLEGVLGDMNIHALKAEMPGNILLNADGEVRSLTDPDNLGGRLRLSGEFRDLEFVREFLPDSMRRRVGFPHRMTLAGNLSIDRDVYAPDLRITADTGYVDIKGRLDLRAESYDATVAAAAFPLHGFLPADSLGLLSLGLTATGHGFDFMSGNTAADIALTIGRFDYMGYNHHDISLEAELADNRLKGTVRSDNEALQLDLAIDGQLSREIYAAHLRGKVALVDLERMRLSETPLAGSGVLDISASASPDTTQMIYSLDAVLDSVRFRHGDHQDNVARTTVKADAGLNSVKAAVRSGDLSLDFTSPSALAALIDGFGRVADTVMRQVNERNIDFHPVEDVMPTFNLDVRIGRNNIAHGIIEEEGLGFNKITLTSYNTDTTAFRFRGLVEGFRTAGLTLDTLNVGLGQRDERLTFYARLANKPGNIEQLALIYLYGTIMGDSIQANFNQRNRDGQKGFVFGINARLQDSSVRATLFPENPIFAYDTWKVNPGNYIEYHFNNEIYADLRLENQTGAGHLKIQSVDYPNMPRGSVRLDIADLDIGKTLDLLPAPPPVGGLLTTNIAFGMEGPLIAANGSAGVKGLTYEKRAVGDVGVIAITSSDDAGLWNVDVGVEINDKSAVSARGTYNMPDGRMNLTVDMPDFPLAAANAFMPPNTAAFAGDLHGNVRLTGTAAAPDITGSLNFTDGRITVPMIGTTFGISPEPIRISRDRVRLRNFGVSSPNNQMLAVNGSVDISDFSRMTADLTISASNFQAVNSPRNRGSQVYGLAALDADLTAKGAVDGLVLRGNVKLLRSTDVIYTMKDSPLSVDDAKQDIVTFVSFADSVALAAQDTLLRARTSGMDMLVNVDIDDDVQATVNLSDNGNDRIELIGGGSLTYIMNNQGDTRLTGRYSLSGGTVVYNPPIPMITQKYFTIDENSYVQWTGEMAAPEFNIRAVETVRTTVKFTDSNESKIVNFEITVLISGSLEKMEVKFDLDAPDSYEIRDDLMAMTAEQRESQAVALLIYNTYTGPSGTAAADTNNALNSLIEKELNQWARNSLKGVDVSFGIQSGTDADGNSHNDYSYKVSKSLFNDRVKVTVGGSVSDNASAQDNLKDNFVDDISLEYRLTKRDNMFLKGYRYTTTDMLEGEITETGGGFLLRKRMEKLSDLFKLNRAPEKREVRDRQRGYRDSLRTRERQAVRDTSGRFSGPEGDSVRRAWRARRDSMRRDSSWRPAPRDPSRFDGPPADSTLSPPPPQGTLPVRDSAGSGVRPPNDAAIKEDDI